MRMIMPQEIDKRGQVGLLQRWCLEYATVRPEEILEGRKPSPRKCASLLGLWWHLTRRTSVARPVQRVFQQCFHRWGCSFRFDYIRNVSRKQYGRYCNFYLWGYMCHCPIAHYSSSPGPDGISTKFLKLAKTISGSLLGRLFQQSLPMGESPDDWKCAHVVPMFKTGDKTSFHNYRPISLACVSCKLLEQIISSKIMTHPTTNQLLFINQHGFLRGR